MVETRGKRSKKENNVAVKSGPRVLTRSRAATAVQKPLVCARPLNRATRPIPDSAARKPFSVAVAVSAAAAAIRSMKVPRGAATNMPAARRTVGKTNARSPERGKQPSEDYALHESQAVQDSYPSSDSSRNSNPLTLRSCRSLEKKGGTPATSSQFHLLMEGFLSDNASEHNEFRSHEFVDKDVTMDVPQGCQQKTSEIHKAQSFNLTEIAGMMNQSCSDDEESESESSIDPCLTNVEGYLVKKEVALLLQQIFDKHKDIARDCTIKSRKNRVLVLEMIYNICQTLEHTSLQHISHDDLQDMSSVVDGFQNMGFDVKWLSKRLHDIVTVKHLLEDHLALNEENTRKIENKQREVEMLKHKLLAGKAELVAMEAEVNKVNHKAHQQINGLIAKGLPYWDKSLLHGLI